MTSIFTEIASSRLAGPDGYEGPILLVPTKLEWCQGANWPDCFDLNVEVLGARRSADIYPMHSNIGEISKSDLQLGENVERPVALRRYGSAWDICAIKIATTWVEVPRTYLFVG